MHATVSPEKRGRDGTLQRHRIRTQARQPIVTWSADVTAVWDVRFVLVAAAAALAGLVRGFSGFGAAMIFTPIASALYQPTVAVPLLFLTDTIVTAPILLRSVRRCVWREVLPMGIGAVLTVPVGAFLLVKGDAVALRWVISVLILGLVGLLATGWRYRGSAAMPTTVGVGGLSGLFGGLAGLAGPPVILFWLSGRSEASVVRANIFVLFGFTTVAGGISYALAGLFTSERFVQVLVLIPVYALATWLGSRLFRSASETLYRRVALGLCATVAVATLPLWQSLQT